VLILSWLLAVIVKVEVIGFLAAGLLVLLLLIWLL